jgi:hypothetical protein
MLISVRVIPVYPGLGLKLGCRRGIATDLICGRGDWVRLKAPVGGAENGVPVVLPGRHFLGARSAAVLNCWGYSNILAAVLV